MTDVTDRLSLPLLAAGQAQKEMTHNEGLLLLDGLVQPVVQSVSEIAPPLAPEPGQAWIIAASPSGDWTGREGQVALFTAGGWRFILPVSGMAFWCLADELPVRHHSGAWEVGQVSAAEVVVNGLKVLGERQPAIAAPTGGGQIDAEARIAISAILAAMKAHGLIAN